jgi:predicted enzyme related to lactoylglutathione lyase
VLVIQSPQTRGDFVVINNISAVWLPVTDMSRAVAFYRDTLGLEVLSTDEDWSMVTAGDQQIGLNARESPAGDGGAVIAFGVEDLEQAVANLRERGAEVTDEISEHPWGRIVPFVDPDGNDLQLYSSPTE